VCDDPDGVLPRAPVRRTLVAAHDGYIAVLPARAVGELSGALGAGRARKGDAVDPAVGLELLVELGDPVEVGTPLAVVHARDEAGADEAEERFAALLTYGEAPPPVGATLLQVIR
jgi:thymidine phosphorylase